MFAIVNWMKNNFCTIVDKNFVFKCLALYTSILEKEKSFTLWVLCMDNETYDIFGKMNLGGLELVKLVDFENEQLRKVKKERKISEYCWTCVPIFCLYLLEKYKQIKNLVYLDSDLYFFSSLDVFFERLEKGSFLLTPHRDGLLKEEAIKGAGIYNAGFFMVKNDEFGRERLKDWGEKCIESCFDNINNGLYAGQWYLNDWSEKYDRVLVLDDKGINTAMWNVFRFNVNKKGKEIYVDDDKLVFYHFSRFEIINKNKFNFNIESLGFKVHKYVIEIIYGPYIKAVKQAIKQVWETDFNFRFGIKQKHYLRR